MANTPVSSGPTTTTTPSSAWSRLVQLTKTASGGSRTKSTTSLAEPEQTSPTSTHASSSAQPAKKRRRTESPPPRPETKCVEPLSPEPNDTQTMSPRKSTAQRPCSRISNHDCITACPCRVEDVDCVALQQQTDKTRSSSPQVLRRVPATVDDIDQDVTPQKLCSGSRYSPAQRIPSPTARPDGFDTTTNATLAQFEEQSTPETSAKEPASSIPHDSASLEHEDDAIVGRIVSEPGQPSMAPSLLVAATGLQEGDQNSVNKTPIPKRHSSSPESTDESIQLATPSSSPSTKSGTRAKETQAEASKPHKSAPAPKTKRRLTLHGGSYERQTSHKKRKTQPKRKDGVQTTLSLAIGSSAGMRECKLCDTVYNPFHPEDVKVHSKRHAIAVKERRSDSISGLTGSSPAD